MYRKLEAYLDEISQYLPLKGGGDDILSEIRSHILEKSEASPAPTEEERITATIAQYGSPREVAAKYLEGTEFIAPIFMHHLVLYTGMLFVVHTALAVLAVVLKVSIVGFPIFFIPLMNVMQLFFYVPMAFFFDLGVVTLFLYFVSHAGRQIKLPWLSLAKQGESRSAMPKPKVTAMILLVLVSGVFLFFFLRFGTTFFLSINDPLHPVPLLGADASLWFSVIFLLILGCQLVNYGIRFLNRSRWFDVLAKGAITVLLLIAWNSPVKVESADLPGLSLRVLLSTGLVIVTVWSVLNFLKTLVLASIGRITPWSGNSLKEKSS